MSLTSLVAQEQWTQFDDAWTQLMTTRDPIDEVLHALRMVAEKKRMPRCIPLVRQHAEALSKQNRSAEAAKLLGTAVVSGAAAGELIPPLLEHSKAAWGSEPWWDAYAQISGLRLEVPDGRKAWLAFERLLDFQTNRIVFHPGGWGAGEIVEVHTSELELSIRFTGNRRDRFPLHAAIEIFEVLSDDDLRAIHFRSPEDLRRRLKEEPLVMLRAIVARHSGRASTTGIKNALLQVGIEGSSWSAWWRKTRKLAENSEWFRVTGTATKGDVLLLHAATDPVADLRKQLETYGSLADLLARIKNQLASKPEERLREMMLDVLDQKTGTAPDPGPVRLAAWMLLRDERGVTSPPLVETLRAAAAQPAAPNVAPPLWALFQSLSGTREQERCVGVLQEVLGEQWADEALRNLHHAPPGMVRPLVEALVAANKRAELASVYRELLARPLRAPEALVALAKLAEGGKLGKDLPPPVQRAQSLLALATNLFVNRRTETPPKLEARLIELLTKGKEPLLRDLLAGADHASLVSVERQLSRGVDEAIEMIVADVVAHAAPVVEGGNQNFFWDDGRIWVTKRGLEKRSQELKHLREVKIPANQDAIGRAAAMGDLSENAEWEAAIEEQRTLTSRAMEIEAELRTAELIDNAFLPEDRVAPGTEVRYRDASTNAEHTIDILGPWDDEFSDRVVSYRAPLAGGLLGKRVGDKTKIQLPSGSIEVEVLGLKSLQL